MKAFQRVSDLNNCGLQREAKQEEGFAFLPYLVIILF
jgi:hypothetical protein